MLGLFLSKFSFVFCVGQQWWHYLKNQLLVSIKCRLGTQCRLRSKLFEYIFWICGFRVIILPDPKVTHCRSPDLFCKKFLQGLFTLKKNIVTNENFYLFFNLKHKHVHDMLHRKGKSNKSFSTIANCDKIQIHNHLLCTHMLQPFAIVQPGGDFC